MKTRYIIILLLGLFVGTSGAYSQAINKLTVGTVEGGLGKEITLPVSLVNDNEVVAIQLTMRIPERVLVNTSSVTLTDRKENHAVSVKSLGNNEYLFVLFSGTNTPIRGNSGALLRIPIVLPEDWEEGSIHPLEFTQVILTNAQGDNIATDSDPGAIKVVVAPRPDIMVENIGMNKSVISPTEKINISWQVRNIGTKETEGGWSEQVILMTGTGDQTLLGTLYYDQLLAAEAMVSRQAEFALTDYPGIEGEAKVVVKLIPSSNLGELTSAQDNNIGKSITSIVINKVLKLNLPQAAIEENSTASIACKLFRSGSWGADQTFVLVANDPSRVELPENVTIQKGQSGVAFYAKLKDNKVLNMESFVTITAQGNGYEPIAGNLYIEDDEIPALTITSSVNELTEGESLTLTISREMATESALTVYLSCDHSKRFTYPAQVEIPAGEMTVTTIVTATEDNIPDVTASVEFAVTAAKHINGQCLVLLNDNDLPEISLSITPETVSESAGTQAIIGVLRRLTNKENAITVHLSDDTKGRLANYPTSLALAAGVEEVRFTIGVIDNALVDGDVEATITAAVYIASCSCSASGTSAGVVEAKVIILDDDGPSLKLVTSQTMLLEGKKDAAVLTVTRNTSVEQPLIVTLSSDMDSELEYEKTVTIPAGSTSIDIPVAVKSNDINEGDRTVTFTVTADGYTKGVCWTMITDQTLPDAIISSLILSVEQAEAESTVDVNVTITNNGVAPLSELTKVSLYLSNSNTRLATLYTQTNLAVGDSETITKKVALPNLTGEYYFTAIVNEEQSVKELLYINNNSERATITLLPKYAVSVTTDKQVYQQGEMVTISGQAVGTNAANAPVEIYLINDGYRQVINATTDGEGKFQTSYTLLAYQIGYFVVGACYPNEGLTTSQAEFDVYGLKRTSTNHITCDILINEPHTESISFSNPGRLGLSGMKTEIISKPENCTVTFTPLTNIEAGGKANLGFTLTGLTPSVGNNWEQIKVRVSSNEGPAVEFIINAYFRSPLGVLQADISTINTTMVKGASRDYSFTITNTGKGETGKITLSLPATTWMTTATPKEMASLKQGESATIVLRFTPTDDMQLNVPVTGVIGINCETGTGIPLTYTIEPVSESTGKLIIDVCDDYTYTTAEAPHVEGAKVLIKHPTTYVILYEGMTNANGLFVVENIPEGYYLLEVSADKHDSYQNNMLVDPGRTTEKEVYLTTGGIVIDWKVEETEITDEYHIITTVEFDTDVPAPIVEVAFPEKLEYKDQLFQVIVTNKGLISAKDVTVELPESSRASFEILSEHPIETLLPQQSQCVYIKMNINKTGTGEKPDPDDPTNPEDPEDPTNPTNPTNPDDPTNPTDPTDPEDPTNPTDPKDPTNPSGPEDPEDPTNPSGPEDPEPGDYCFTITIHVFWDWICGPDGHWYKAYVDRTYQYGNCTSTPPTSGGYTSGYTGGYTGGGGSLGGVGGGTGSGYFGGSGGTTYIYEKTDIPCDPKDKPNGPGDDDDPDDPDDDDCPGKKLKAMADCVSAMKDISKGCPPNPFGCVNGLINNCGLDFNIKSLQDILDCSLSGLSCVPGGWGCLGSGLGCLRGILEPCDGYKDPEWWDNLVNNKVRRYSKVSTSVDNLKDLPAYYEYFLFIAYNMYLYSSSIEDVYTEIFGDACWTIASSAEIEVLLSYLQDNQDSNGIITIDSSIYQYKPENITDEELNRFIERWNNSMRKEQGAAINENYIDRLILQDNYETIQKTYNLAVARGYESVEEMFSKEFDIAIKETDNNSTSSSVCASITLQFSQTMTMTRQAFRGTLSVFNGHESVAMENVKLDLVITDEDGKTTTLHEFQTNTEKLDVFSGDLDGSWTLDAQSTGVATILFIPTKYAAPTEPKDYSFGGTLSYTDPFTGLEVTRDLHPVTLTVKPSPNLSLTYFMERDILGDDPLTKDVVEPMVPAEFSLLMHNTGYGDATNVRMVTEQPEIIENEKDLFIAFELLSSQLKGNDHTLALGGNVATEFGDVPAGTTTYAQWWFTSTLLGHFTDYNVEATHVSSYGNPDLSLLDEVSIHELIRSIKVPVADALLTGFVVNDVPDADDLPDALYLSDGTIETVYATHGIHFSPDGENQYKLTVPTLSQGWNYGVVSDPTNGRQKLAKVVRVSDNAEINLQNFWQTDRTLRDGKDPLYENRLHLVDNITSGNEQYILTFEPRPSVTLTVETFLNVPDGVAAEPVSEINVCFNKAIEENSFTIDDLTFNCQGSPLDKSKVVISKVNEKEYKLNLSALTQENGYYVLTVQAATIADKEGYTGESGKNVSWNQYLGNKVPFNVAVLPVDAGEVKPGSGEYAYGSALDISAEPTVGYQFVNWTIGGIVASTNAIYKHTVLSGQTITANFKLRTYDFTLINAPGGIVEGAGIGKYDHNTSLTLQATPHTNYYFAGWKLNGELMKETTDVITITITSQTILEAVFIYNPVISTDYQLSEGWNWISVNTSATTDTRTLFQPIKNSFEQLVGFSAELVNDPVYGLTGGLNTVTSLSSYKLNMKESASIELSGLAYSIYETIQLGKGWNWIGYLPIVELSLETAFSDLQAENGDVIKSQTDFSIFDGGKWTGTLIDLKPGEGYMYSSQSSKGFKYAAIRVSTVSSYAMSVPSMGASAGIWPYNPHKYPNNMNLIAQLYNEGVKPEVGIYTVGAFSGNECRGIGKYVDGTLFITVHGSEAGELISFVALENATNKKFRISESIRFNDVVVGSLQQPYKLNVSGSTIVQSENVFLTIYPNPVKDKLFIGGDIPEIKTIRVLNVAGNTVLQSDTFTQDNGLDVSSLIEGTYILAIHTVDGIIYKKFIKAVMN